MFFIKTLQSNKGYPTLAWMVIIGMILFILFGSHLIPRPSQSADSTASQPDQMDRAAQAQKFKLDAKEEVLDETEKARLVRLISIAVAIAVLVGAFLLYYFWRYGHMRFRIYRVDHGIYAEAFAIWMVVFWLLQSATFYFASLYIPRFLWLAIGGSFFLSFIVLLWPLYRGFSWNEIKRDFGFHKGEGWIIEILYGLLGYLITLPLMMLGLLITLFLKGNLSLSPGELIPLAASHPIISVFANADPWTRVQIVFVMILAAGITEEGWFRGPLPRHIIEWFSPSSKIVALAIIATGCIVVSGLVSSFVFAIVHPQGLEGVPVLMAMAGGFFFMRIYRDSIIAPAVTHMTANSVTIILVLLTIG